MTNALARARRVSCAVWCMVDLSVTVGREARSLHQPVMLVVTSPVRPFERLRTRAHRSPDEAPPVWLSQDLGTKPRRHLLGQLAVTALKVRLPCRSAGRGMPRDLDVAWRC